MPSTKTARVDPSFWNGKRVFLTGHTGFKGGWLSLWLASMGAKVTGYALAPNTIPSFFEVAKVADDLEQSHIADIRDLEKLQKAMADAKPEIVIHMAAQPLVRYSYVNPVLQAHHCLQEHPWLIPLTIPAHGHSVIYGYADWGSI